MAATDPTIAAVCDAGPLIHLNELECLEGLGGFSGILIPQEVWNETHRHCPALMLDLIPNAALMQATTSDVPRALMTQHGLKLDAGELAALSLMQSGHATLLLTDDLDARRAAELLGLRAQGTLGLLLRAARLKLRRVEEIRSLLTSLRQRSTLHVTEGLLREALRRLSERHE